MALPSRPLVQLSAYEDISAIAEGLERFSGKRDADTAVEHILVGIDSLASSPYLGPLHQDPMLACLGYRKLVLGKYIVAYRVDDDCATVLRVFHGSSNYAGRIDT